MRRELTRRQWKNVGLGAFVVAALCSAFSTVVLIRALKREQPVEQPAPKKCWPVCWVVGGDGQICCGDASTLEECALRGQGVPAFREGPCPNPPSPNGGN